MAKQKEFSTGKIIGLLALTLVGVLVLYLVFVGIYSATYREKFDATIEGNGYVTAKGKSLYDGQGNALRLIGTNAGALFVPEGWLTVYSIGYDEYLSLDAYILCEWSENIENAIPSDAITVTIRRTDGESGREILIKYAD